MFFMESRRVNRVCHVEPMFQSTDAKLSTLNDHQFKVGDKVRAARTGAYKFSGFTRTMTQWMPGEIIGIYMHHVMVVFDDGATECYQIRYRPLPGELVDYYMVYAVDEIQYIEEGSENYDNRTCAHCAYKTLCYAK